MKNPIKQFFLIWFTFGISILAGAQQVNPSVVVCHSAGTDLLGLIQFEEGWGANAPKLAAYVDHSLGGKENFTILNQVTDTMDSGETTVVAMLNSGLFLDKQKDGGTTRRAADQDFQNQLDRFFLVKLFNAENPSWVQFETSPLVQNVLNSSTENYKAVERYLGNFLDLKSEIGFLEQVFAYKFDRYVVVPSFFFLPHSGSGIAIQDGEERSAFFMFGVQTDIEEGKAPELKNTGFTKTSEIASLAVHEFAHTFYGQQLRSTQSQAIVRLREKFKNSLDGDFDRLGYNNNNWEGIFEEYFVRSIEVLYCEKSGSKAEAEELLQYERNLGFSHMEVFINGIKKSLIAKDFNHVIDSIEREMQS